VVCDGKAGQNFFCTRQCIWRQVYGQRCSIPNQRRNLSRPKLRSYGVLQREFIDIMGKKQTGAGHNISP
jgi:hypothetical protein